MLRAGFILKLMKTYIPQRSGKKWEKFEKKEFQFWKINFRLRNRYRNRTLVLVLNTDTEFWSLTIKNAPLSNLHVNCRIVDVWIFRLGDCNSIIVIYSQAINHGFGCWITWVNGPILAFFARKIFHTFITAVTLCKNWGFYLEKKMLCMNIQSQMAYLELSIDTRMNVF